MVRTVEWIYSSGHQDPQDRCVYACEPLRCVHDFVTLRNPLPTACMQCNNDVNPKTLYLLHAVQ